MRAWLGGSSWRGRFGDSGVPISSSSISARAAAEGEGSGARSMNDPIRLLVVIVLGAEHIKNMSIHAGASGSLALGGGGSEPRAR